MVVFHVQQDQMAIVKDQGDEALYDKLDLDYPTSDEDDKDDESEVWVYFIFYTHLFFSPRWAC